MLHRTTLALLATTAGLVAQADYDYDKLTSARLGATLDLHVSGAPANQLIVFLASSTGGPIPLSVIDPTDTRMLQVGVELLGSMLITVTSPTGEAPYSVPLPLSASLHGVVFHWQSVMLELGAHFFGELGNDVVTQLGLPDTPALATAALASARAFAAVGFDRNNNAGQGDVLVIGGGAGTLTSATGLASTERWDFRHMTVSPGPSMGTARALHSAITLNNGKVLVIGGADQNGNPLASCELYDPVTNSFAPTGSMGTPRVLFGACKLANGNVMVAGGTSALQPDVTTAVTSTLNTAEIYNATTGTWSNANNIGGYRLGPALTLLPNNNVMVSGGVQIGFFLGVPLSAVSTTAVQFWNPSNGNWSGGPAMLQGRAGHQYNQVTLANGRVLMTGGVYVPSLLGATSAAPVSNAEYYNPTNNTWTSVNMTTARALHTADLLPDGRVAVCGGAQGTLLAPVSIDNVDVFNPATNSWTSMPALTGPRASHASALLPDGTLVLFGGQGATTTTAAIDTIRF
ncbi:MAG: hypothetical protein K8J09_13540 [Planctomycetes bacterium]|nr:hypothetical protein [Planctomycetota bacterium]MCC7395623.1 hypothetical protein [Planctomycetota bacterium]